MQDIPEEDDNTGVMRTAVRSSHVNGRRMSNKSDHANWLLAMGALSHPANRGLMPGILAHIFLDYTYKAHFGCHYDAPGARRTLLLVKTVEDLPTPSGHILRRLSRLLYIRGLSL